MLNPEKEPQMDAREADEVLCSSSMGNLGPCVPLAVPCVPFQQEKPTVYRKSEALAQGTLFPGLNLPFHLKRNGSPVPVTPLSELQALQFVLVELGLYLDTHPEDKEALELFQKYAELEKKGKLYYEANFGPLNQCDGVQHGEYTWIKGPWPWEKGGNE